MSSNFSLNLKKILEKRQISVKQFAKAIGASRQSVSLWLKGRNPTKNLFKISEVLNIPIEDLLKGDLSDFEDVGALSTQSRSDLVAIPEYELNFSAGDGAVPTWEETHNTTPAWYRDTFFKSRGIKPEKCKRAKVSGDSMYPMICDGDTILFEELIDPVRVNEGSVYVLAIDGALRVKCLSKRVDGSLVIRSINKDYGDEVVSGQELDKVTILGKVLEINRSLK